eukprot:scaffold2805_cov48-Tisochrysis_lutea.AAC.1
MRLYLRDEEVGTGEALSLGLVQHVCDTPEQAQAMASALAAGAVAAREVGVRALSLSERRILASEAWSQAKSAAGARRAPVAVSPSRPNLVWTSLPAVDDAAKSVPPIRVACDDDSGVSAIEFSCAQCAAVVAAQLEAAFEAIRNRTRRVLALVLCSATWQDVETASIEELLSVLTRLRSLRIPLISV